VVDIEALLSISATVRPRKLSNETDFKYHWQQSVDTSWTPEQVAFMGGLLADRLSFLFIAGYQAAVRRTFDIHDNAWCVLAVSEDQSPTNPKPGLSIDANGNLNGNKTWVASSRCAESLIVSVGKPGNGQLYKVSREQSGLTIHHKDSPRFLGDMSQGIAEFSDVRIDAIDLVAPVNLKLFAKREPLFIYLAFCGFLQTRLSHPLAPDMIEGLLTIAAGDFSDENHKQLFAKIDTQIFTVFEQIEPTMFEGNYTNDKDLMSLYSKVIQKRAGLG
jgi:hypothetical protein